MQSGNPLRLLQKHSKTTAKFLAPLDNDVRARVEIQVIIPDLVVECDKQEPLKYHGCTEGHTRMLNLSQFERWPFRSSATLVKVPMNAKTRDKCICHAVCRSPEGG